MLHRLLASSRLLTPSRLEATRRYDHYRLPTGVTLQLPCGWYLWVITLQYYAIDHASDLTLSLSP